ncbi:MAG: hypothetical protein AAF922_15905 [Pseudomonadota bacterium]
MRRLTLLIAMLLGTTVSADEKTVPLGPNPVMAGGIFDRGGGGITVAAELRETVDGQMAVCGVWARSRQLNAYARIGARDTLVPALIRVNGNVVRRDLRVFPRVAAADSYAGAPARCVTTGLTWRPDAPMEVSVPRQIVHQNGRSDNGGGFRLILNRTDEPNPALRRGSLLPESWTNLRFGVGG